MSIHMGSQNISVKREAYDFLSSLKGKDKSFSDVILEFKGHNAGITRFFGVLRDKDWGKAKKEMRSLRKEFEERLK